MLSIRNLGWRYPEQNAVLRDVSFEVAPGEICVLLGPSGCGKTTLLHCVAGLLPVQSGEIVLDGRPPKPGVDTALVFQDMRLLPWRRLRENLTLVMRGGSRAARREAAEALLERVGLSGLGDAWPEELSGGMQQRLALARALATPARVLLMDEPFASLDPLAREDMQAEVLRLRAAEPERRILFVTHSVDEALVLADRIILMGAGAAGIVDRLVPGWSVLGAERRRTSDWPDRWLGLSERLREAALRAQAPAAVLTPT